MSPLVSETGVVTAVGEGVTTITATSHNGIEETCLIYVTIPVGQIELSLVDAEKAEVGVGETLRVQAVAYNSDGTTDDVAQTFDWRVSNGNASIIGNADGSATITGLRGGTVTIGAFATDGSGVNAQMTITVIIPVESFYIIPATANVNVGSSTTLKVNGSPLNATYHNATDFTWESSDEGIATVSETGVVTGVSEGTATITVTSHNGIEQTCLVTVSIRTNTIDITVEGGGAAEVSEGASDLTLRATALGPDGTSGSVAQDFNWNSEIARRHPHQPRRWHCDRHGPQGRLRQDRRRGQGRLRRARRDRRAHHRAGKELLDDDAQRHHLRRRDRQAAGQRHTRQRHLPWPDGLHLGKQR